MNWEINKRKIVIFTIVLLSVCALAAVGERPVKMQDLMQGYHAVIQTMPEGKILAASSAVGSPAYHRHLVRAGSLTTYMLRVLNTEQQTVEANLKIEEVTDGWSTSLQESKLSLAPGEKKYTMLTLKASPDLPKGSAASVKVGAVISTGKSDEITLEAEITEKHKIYIISLDSFGTEYLRLNSKGTGPASEGDMLTPNVDKMMKTGVYYPLHKVHLISATDGNHAVYLSGAYPGRLGIYSVQIFFFGFDDNGNPITKSNPLDIMYYGEDGKPVTTIFNVVKDPKYGGNPNAFSAYASGKAWVPEHYRNPVFGLDRIATVNDYPDYVIPYPHPHSGEWLRNIFIKAHISKLKDPDLFAWEDNYTVDQAIETINNEDPDIFYLLLSATDMAGHAYGAGYKLDEWNNKGTPDNLADDISKINPHANREGIIETVRNADAQLGRLIEYLRKRGTLDDAIIAIESDHNMETNFFDGPPVQKIMAKTGYSDKKDYFIFTLNQIGAVFFRHHNSPEMAEKLEEALESYRMKNPLTGNMDTPITVMTRNEMRIGIDERTGKRISLPAEVYSEYYIEHPKSGGLQWPDLLLLIDKYYQFPTLGGAGLANIGASQIKVPPVHIFIGGHGSFSTQGALMTISGPGVPSGEIVTEQTYAADLIPTLYRLEGYGIPESVQGKGLPKADPIMR